MFRGGLGKILANELKDGIDKHYNASDCGGVAAPSVASIWDKLQTNVGLSDTKNTIISMRNCAILKFDLIFGTTMHALLVLDALLWCHLIRRLVRHKFVAG